MPDFFINPIWQQVREQTEDDFETVTKQLLEAVPTVRRSYQFHSSQRTPFYALATYKNHDSKRADFLVLLIIMRLHTREDHLTVTSYLDRDDVEDRLMILPDLPDGPMVRIPLPPLKDKSHSEIEEFFELPSVVSRIDEVMLAVRRFVTDKETVNAVIQELHR